MSIQDFEVLENRNRKKIVNEFIRKKTELEYSHISQLLSGEEGTNRPDFHLDVLVKAGILKRLKKRGYYKLNEKVIQPLRGHFNERLPICLIGGLGIYLELVSEILMSLQEFSLLPKKYIFITSPEIKDEFEKLDKSGFVNIDFEIFDYDYQEILRGEIEELYEILEKIIKKEIFSFEIICEITGGTKPVSLALNNLALEYGLNRSYYTGNRIIWL